MLRTSHRAFNNFTIDQLDTLILGLQQISYCFQFVRFQDASNINQDIVSRFTGGFSGAAQPRLLQVPYRESLGGSHSWKVLVRKCRHSDPVFTNTPQQLRNRDSPQGGDITVGSPGPQQPPDSIADAQPDGRGRRSENGKICLSKAARAPHRSRHPGSSPDEKTSCPASGTMRKLQPPWRAV